MKKIKYFIFLLLLTGILYSEDNELIKNIKQSNLKGVEGNLNADNINLVDDYGWTPIMWAVWSGNNDIVNLLLSQGAKLDNSLSDETAFELASFNKYDDILKSITSENAVYNNLDVSVDDVSGDKIIKSYLFTSENPPTKIGVYRVFAKIEDGELYYAIGLKLLNTQQKETNGVVYSNKKQFETYIKQFKDSFYKGKGYFTELYTILFERKDFEKFASMTSPVNFGVRRGKVDFDFQIPASTFKAILKKVDEDLQGNSSDQTQGDKQSNNQSDLKESQEVNEGTS